MSPEPPDSSRDRRADAGADGRDIEQLRDEIARVDDELVAAVARRRRLAASTADAGVARAEEFPAVPGVDDNLVKAVFTVIELGDDAAAGGDGLRAVDREIAELIERRTRIAREVAAYKLDHGRSLNEEAQIETVVDRAAAAAERHGVDPGVVRATFRILVGLNMNVEKDVLIDQLED